ncbi:MAG: amidophosphoribosyltransferase [Bacteroidaceae bacterium]|nr:amidophosphoribosyltransferase [Bacteroidaceae bacterium]
MEELKHECGIVLMRLLKPLSWYQKKYGSWMYPMRKLYLMMEKQKNRGQEGAGIACLKMNAQPGEEYIFRERELGKDAITEVFNKANRCVFNNRDNSSCMDPDFAERWLPYAGEIYMGHLRYSTTGKSGMEYLHPFMRRNNWRAKNLLLCGNFSMTNNDEVFEMLTEKGQHPRRAADSFFLLEFMGHRLDREVERVYQEAVEKGLENRDITEYIEAHVDMRNVLRTCCPAWDGGYVIEGVTGSGESFVVRDPWGVRTAFWYANDEMVVVTSERPAMQNALTIEVEDIHELQPGQALLINNRGEVSLEQIMEQKALLPCCFERVYFSRGNDKDIYRERKKLGELLLEPVLKAIDNDLVHTVFSFIPNTAEVASVGMVQAFENYLGRKKIEKIVALGPNPSQADLEKIILQRIRNEKVALKDIKLRTFITEGNSRNDLAGHVYDITYGSIVPYEDNLVIIDDSIVRGTTLRESILSILDRLHPKKIVIVSSSPQVRYPDYYGIDMESMDQFIAFIAAMDLLRERGLWNIVTDTYLACKHQLTLPKEQMVNAVKRIYEPFTEAEVGAKIAELLRPANLKADFEIVYQTMEGLHTACPNHLGDWYFSGNYPTPGGVRRVNMAYIDYYEKNYINN